MHNTLNSLDAKFRVISLKFRGIIYLKLFMRTDGQGTTDLRSNLN